MNEMERLLKLVADYHSFCFDNDEQEKKETEPDELCLDQLDMVAAAAHQIPTQKNNSHIK